MSVIATGAVEQKQAAHIKRKKLADQIEEKDKKSINGIRTITLDLQQLPSAPRLFNGSAYYTRELNCYNLTIYEQQREASAIQGMMVKFHEVLTKFRAV